MKIITYNIWDVEWNFKKRMELLAIVLKESQADVVALQEVRDEKLVNYLKKECHYEYSLWKQYYDWNEGLAILSKYPIIFHENNWEEKINKINSFALRILIQYQDIKIGFTNVHLDYEKALNRENRIVEIVKMIENKKCGDYEFLLGDFNSNPLSSVYQYLTAQQSLNEHSTNWIDLAVGYESLTNKKAEATLDFQNNPRWDNKTVFDLPSRFDWIFLKCSYKESPKLKAYHIIGNERKDNLTPSDHYGVLCDIDF